MIWVKNFSDKSGCCFGFKLPAAVSLFGLFSVDRFPTQLIEALFELILFAVVFACQKKKEDIDALKLYLMCYAVFRFIIEFTRADSVRGVFFGISTSQLVSAGILIYYSIRYFAKTDKAAKIN